MHFPWRGHWDARLGQIELIPLPQIKPGTLLSAAYVGYTTAISVRGESYHVERHARRGMY